MIKQDLIDAFDYDINTGIFIAKYKSSNGKRKKGDIANAKTSTGYEKLSLNKETILVHRALWWLEYDYLPSFPEEEIDHINHNRRDNRLCNLRLVNKTSNQKNASIRTDNKTGKTGVSWNSRDKIYTVAMSINGKTKYLGCSKTLEVAEEIRDKANKDYKFHNNHGK